MYKRLNLLFVLILVFSCSKNNTEEVIPMPPEGGESSNVIEGVLDGVSLIGGTKIDSGKKIIKTNDGGFIVVGFAQSNDLDVSTKNNESIDAWALKFNASGEKQWYKTYGGSKTEVANDVIQTQDGGYIILGVSESSDGDVAVNAGATDIWLFKIDSSGNLLWEKSYGYSGADAGTAIIQTQDGGYFISGVLDVTASNGEGSTLNKKHAGGDYWGIKTNAQGDIQWSQYFGGTFSDTPYDVIQTSDNGLILIGTSDSNDVDITDNQGTYDYWVVKVSSSGETLWKKNYGGSESEDAKAICPDGQGNYIIIGQTRSSDQDVANQRGGADVWALKINTQGNILWEKTYGGNSFDAGLDIIPDNDNGFLIAGHSRSETDQLTDNKGQNDLWVFKIDQSGSLIWQVSAGGDNIDVLNSITQLDNGDIYAVGETQSNNGDLNSNNGFLDLVLIKIK